MNLNDPSFETRWRRRFDEFAETHDTDASIAGWSETGLQARVRGFLRHWVRRPIGERWLDLGCGAGTYTRLLSEQGLDVVGADYSPRTLSKARLRSTSSIDWVSADARRLPFHGGTFDGILCFGVTQALSQTLTVAMEAARVLRPGGYLWIDALNAGCVANVWANANRRVTGQPSHLRFERVSSVRRALTEAGFHTLGVYWLPLAPAGWKRTAALADSAGFRRLLQVIPPAASVLSHSFIVLARR